MLGGPVTMFVWLLVLLLPWFLIAAVVVSLVLSLTLLGGVLSLIGGVDQARLAITS